MIKSEELQVIRPDLNNYRKLAQLVTKQTNAPVLCLNATELFKLLDYIDEQKKVMDTLAEALQLLKLCPHSVDVSLCLVCVDYATAAQKQYTEFK